MCRLYVFNFEGTPATLMTRAGGFQCVDSSRLRVCTPLVLNSKSLSLLTFRPTYVALRMTYCKIDARATRNMLFSL